MTTLVRKSNKPTRRTSTLKKSLKQPVASLKDATEGIKAEETFQHIPEKLIDFSPFNYRRVYPESQLQELATGILQVGILHPIKVRPVNGGRYQLIIGEGRLRAARIAGLQNIPATVGEYTDEQAKEMQLQENLQRTNPHPLDEAIAIMQMQDSGKTIEEIAARLGKSQKFVFVRLRISKLTELLKAVFAADKITLTDAWDLAGLTPESQQDFYDIYLQQWQRANFRGVNVRGNLYRFTQNLKHAPFNTKDKKLIPEAGACTNCPFNSAVLKTLFPELAKEAVCQNKSCYQQKCQRATELSLAKVAAELQPDAVLHYYGLNDTEKTLIDSLPETGGIPQHCVDDITIKYAPTAPNKEQFIDYSYGEEDDEEGNEVFDEISYHEAVKEYEQKVNDYNEAISTGKYQKGMLLQNGVAKAVYFLPEKARRESSSGSTVTAKEVQEAIKSGTATVQLLEQEIERLQNYERRKLEIDRDKVQAALHAQFLEGEANQTHKKEFTAADTVAMRLIIIQSLDWSVRHKVETTLFNEVNTRDLPAYYQAIANLTDEQVAFLVRVAIAGNSESKLPGFITGYAMYQMAEQAGTDVAGIEADQTAKAEARAKKLAEKVQLVNVKIAILQA